jgi:hypothetical protein
MASRLAIASAREAWLCEGKEELQKRLNAGADQIIGPGGVNETSTGAVIECPEATATFGTTDVPDAR